MVLASSTLAGLCLTRSSARLPARSTLSGAPPQAKPRGCQAPQPRGGGLRRTVYRPPIRRDQVLVSRGPWRWARGVLKNLVVLASSTLAGSCLAATVSSSQNKFFERESNALAGLRKLSEVGGAADISEMPHRAVRPHPDPETLQTKWNSTSHSGVMESIH